MALVYRAPIVYSPDCAAPGIPGCSMESEQLIASQEPSSRNQGPDLQPASPVSSWLQSEWDDRGGRDVSQPWGQSSVLRMKALEAALLVLLFCGPPGPTRGQLQAQDDEYEDDVDPGQEGYDDDDDDDDDEDEGAGVPGDSGDDGLLRCYACQSLAGPERCPQQQRCGPRHRFCKTLVSHGETESGPLTTYSAWCSDSCRPLSKTVERTLMTVTCCEAPLCNVPPWQGPGAGPRDPQGGGPWSPRGAGAGAPWSCPLAVAASLWLSLLAGLRFLGP
ncbi:glycosylphosphatidylinositol-anchored high density lipoprotein-binding protein 1 [Suncus etruscus]|uniref:glycosylphosphatidylinositol-anchored high density lipoprotein-binding protein 1 n=1 Tax=Suncus etruscus TaxID=109475 RepID=UPI00210F7EA2|nr:glycosylphosphatidylinositol-anchored high density lipoprotein-binding protein 1 [Suncus etruscus]